MLPSPVLIPSPVVIVAQRVPDGELARTAVIHPNPVVIIAPVLPAPAVGVRELAPEFDAPPRIRGTMVELKPFALATYYMVSER
jgi:hypothetical protein